MRCRDGGESTSEQTTEEDLDGGEAPLGIKELLEPYQMRVITMDYLMFV